MRVDFIANPEFAERYLVTNAEDGEEIKDIAWADDEARRYARFRCRPRMLTDPKGADLRLRHPDGTFRLAEHNAEIQIEDLAVNPLKEALLALLDDPEVIAKLRALLT